MVELTRLVFIIEKRAKKNALDMITLSTDNLEANLFQLVKENKVDSDAAAIEALYGDEKNTKGFKMLKSRLKKKLYAAIDTIDINEFSLRKELAEELRCLILIKRANTFLRLGERTIALKVVMQALIIAKEYNNVPLLLNCYELQYKILHDLDDYTAFKKCEIELEYYKKISVLELEANILYFNARFGVKHVVAGRKEHLDKLPQAIETLEQKWEESRSDLIFKQLHVLRIQYFECIGDYQKIVEIIDSVEKLVAEGVISCKTTDERFNKFIKSYAHLQLRQYDTGLVYASSIEHLFLSGSCNWAAFMENYFLMALQSHKLDLAADIFNRLYSSEVLKIIDVAARERWILYIHFFNLVSVEGIKPERISGSGCKKLLKQTIRDKDGFNLSIIILDMFKLLEEEEMDDTSLYSDRIRKYMSKYLQQKEAERPRLFLKLLLLMFKENLDPVACRKKGRYLLQKLKNTPLPGNAFAEVEIIPYEQLWELVLSKLAGDRGVVGKA